MDVVAVVAGIGVVALGVWHLGVPAWFHVREAVMGVFGALGVLALVLAVA